MRQVIKFFVKFRWHFATMEISSTVNVECHLVKIALTFFSSCPSILSEYCDICSKLILFVFIDFLGHIFAYFAQTAVWLSKYNIPDVGVIGIAFELTCRGIDLEFFYIFTKLTGSCTLFCNPNHQWPETSYPITVTDSATHPKNRARSAQSPFLLRTFNSIISRWRPGKKQKIEPMLVSGSCFDKIYNVKDYAQKKLFLKIRMLIGGEGAVKNRLRLVSGCLSRPYL